MIQIILLNLRIPLINCLIFNFRRVLLLFCEKLPVCIDPAMLRVKNCRMIAIQVRFDLTGGTCGFKHNQIKQCLT
jgi:hypothetical protein